MSLRIGATLPELSGATGWLNGAAVVRRDDLLGAPALVHFWSTSCRICKENLPTVQEWKRRFAPKGLKVVAVYVPDADRKMDEMAAKAREAAGNLGITEPCAVDSEGTVREAFLNAHGCAPAYCLFDAEGKLRGRAAGDAGLRMLEGTLKRLLEAGETAPAA